jgi:hypothetical protein
VTTLAWIKLAIIGMPGSECGSRLLDDGVTAPEPSFRAEYPCTNFARWCVGDGLLICQEHAAVVAAEFGDDITEIENALKQ